MRVFCAGIETETNTFSPLPTGHGEFTVMRTAELDSLEHSPIGLWRNRCRERQWTFLFSLFAEAKPAGPTVREVYENLRDEILRDLEAALPLDIVLLPLHGAMVAHGYDDCDGDLLKRIRGVVGKQTVIAAELDLHAHLSETMLENADLLIGYKEYPHSDILARAGELFDLAVAARDGSVSPRMTVFDCCMVGLYPTTTEPMRSFVDQLYRLEQQPGILSITVIHGFPWGDVSYAGTKVLVVGDGTRERAAALAQTLGMELYRLRRRLGFPVLTLEQAFDKAVAATALPVVIADQADNAGGGAASDSTFALRELIGRRIRNAGLAILWDPLVVELAKSAGTGATLDIRVGGKFGPCSGDPLDLTVTVTGIRERYFQQWPQSDGAALLCPLGDTVALHHRGIDIIVSSLRCQNFTPGVFSDFGIDPGQKAILVVKSSQHFHTGYASLAGEIIYMGAPGTLTPDIRHIPYRIMGREKYPWRENPLAELQETQAILPHGIQQVD